MEFFIDDKGFLAALSPVVPANEHPVACGDPLAQEPLQIKFPVGTTVPEGCAFILFKPEEFDGFGAYRYGM